MTKATAAISDVAAFVLAGGQSTRMGRDKSLVSFAGRPLITFALDTLRDAGFSPSIAGARSPLAPFAPVIEDAKPDRGPLGGICAALATVQSQCAVFLPVDLPLLPTSLIAVLLLHAQMAGSAVTIPSISGLAQTFPVVLHRAALPLLESELAAGRFGCFAAFSAAAAALGEPASVVPVELLVQSGQVAHPAGLPAFRWFLNVNAPRDLALAASLSSHRVA